MIQRIKWYDRISHITIWLLRIPAVIEEIQLTNFKSFAGESEPIRFAPVTILVGANASGKSNLFDALRFLQRIGGGLTIGEALFGKWANGQEVFPALRGGATEATYAGQTRFALQTRSRLVPPHGTEAPTYREAIRHHIECDVKLEPYVVAESVSQGSDASAKMWQVDDDKSFHAKVSVQGQDPRELRLTGEVPTESLLSLAKTLPLELPHVRTVMRFGSIYLEHRFLDLRPSLMRDYVSTQIRELGTHGENLSATLLQLVRNTPTRKAILDWLNRVSAPAIRDIGFVSSQTGEVLLCLEEADGKQRSITARSLSDGTLRFLAILAALYSAPEGSVFLLEEIENGLHPTRIHLLVELLEQFAEARKLQIIATTHNSQVLLSLSPQALRNVVLFARPEDQKGTVTHRLGDLPHFDEVTKKTSIDRLFTTGWLEQAL